MNVRQRMSATMLASVACALPCAAHTGEHSGAHIITGLGDDSSWHVFDDHIELDLFVPQEAEPVFEVALELGGEWKRVAFGATSISSDRRAGDDDPDRPVTTYRGRVEGWPGAEVAGSILSDGLHALILGSPNGRGYSIQPSGGLPLTPGGVRHHVISFASPPTTKHFTGAPVRVAEVGFEVANDFYVAAGGTSADAVATVSNIVNQASLLYEYYFDVRFELNDTNFVLQTVLANDPYDGLFLDGPGGMMDTMLNEWVTNHQGIARDVAHLFTIGEVADPDIGLASGIVCGNVTVVNMGASISAGGLAFELSRVKNFAHEVGHNMTAAHCTDPGAASLSGCGIMDVLAVKGTGYMYFNGFTLTEIQADYLDNPNSACMTSDVSIADTITLTGAVPPTVSLFGGTVRLQGTHFDQVVLLDWNGVFHARDHVDVDFLSDTEVDFTIPGVQTPGTTVQVAVLGVGGVLQTPVTYTCTGDLQGPSFLIGAGVPTDWDYCGPVGFDGELVVARSGTTVKINGFDVLAFRTVLSSGLIGGAPFTNTDGVGSYTFTPPSQQGLIRFQFIVRDASGAIVGASPVSLHFITI